MASCAAAGAEEQGASLPSLIPGADRVGGFAGDPPAAIVYRDGEPVGYVFSTQAVIGSVGYSGKPIDILVGLEEDGRIAGARLESHQEPILVIGVSDEDLQRFVAGFTGFAVDRSVGENAALPDAISGATVSSSVIRDSILRSARAVAGARGLLAQSEDAPRLDRESFEPATWDELTAEGSVARLRLTRGEVESAFAVMAATATSPPGGAFDPESLFIDLFAGLATPARVGENLLGKQQYNRLVAEMDVADNLLVVAANGLFSFKGTRYVRSGVFDRIQLTQGERTIRLAKDDYRLVEEFRAEGAPEFREIGVFVIPADSGFDPLLPWQLQLLVERRTAQGAVLWSGFDLAFELPGRYVVAPPREGSEAAREGSGPGSPYLSGAGAEELWISIWRERQVTIALLAVHLVVLLAILVFQDALVRRQRLYRVVRVSFLAVTLLWLGWLVGGQLSVVNVLTFTGALLSEFNWTFFLLDPVSFVLWSFVAVTLLFWGRGVFCGWLCPFGALQELLNGAARRFRVPQITVPFMLHERLWPIKYVLFLGLFAVSLHAMNLAVLGAEIEPFKTAITLKFVRHWPFVLYAVTLLVAGLFIERFFCRYLCPLGAALAIPARLRMFDWLKRKQQCGRACHKCAERCTVQAIHPDGHINPNECIQCLNCQAMYYDADVCLPLIAARKRAKQSMAPALQEQAGP